MHPGFQSIVQAFIDTHTKISFKLQNRNKENQRKKKMNKQEIARCAFFLRDISSVLLLKVYWVPL